MCRQYSYFSYSKVPGEHSRRDLCYLAPVPWDHLVVVPGDNPQPIKINIFNLTQAKNIIEKNYKGLTTD